MRAFVCGYTVAQPGTKSRFATRAYTSVNPMSTCKVGHSEPMIKKRWPKPRQANNDNVLHVQS
jgi:hypothetical protein